MRSRAPAVPSGAIAAEFAGVYRAGRTTSPDDERRNAASRPAGRADQRPLDGLVRRAGSAARSRRQAILAFAASVAVVLAVIAYVVDQQNSHTGLSQIELRDGIAKRSPTAESPRRRPIARLACRAYPTTSSAVQSARPPSTELLGPAPALDATPNSARRQHRARDDATGARARRASPENAAAVPAPPQPPRSCSGPAFVL